MLISFLVTVILLVIYSLPVVGWLRAVDNDIQNLYQSRDGLWKELFKLQQTNKRRDSALRRRIHNLERKINVITRGKNETFKPYQKEETGENSEFSTVKYE